MSCPKYHVLFVLHLMCKFLCNIYLNNSSLMFPKVNVFFFFYHLFLKNCKIARCEPLVNNGKFSLLSISSYSSDLTLYYYYYYLVEERSVNIYTGVKRLHIYNMIILSAELFVAMKTMKQ